MPVAEIARTLDVAYVLDGSVRKAGDRLRVAVRLIRADNGYVAWSESYDRPVGDILMIQDNGHGFMPGAAGSGSEAGGFGLIGVSERAQLLRGKVAIHSEPGQGTTVSVRVPLLRGDKHGQ